MSKKKVQPKVVKVMRYEFVHTVFDDGTADLLRTNDGFNLLELLGLLELTRDDIHSLFKNGYPKPTEITRQFVKQ